MFPVVSNYIGMQISNSETEDFDNRINSILDDSLTFDEAYKKGNIDNDGYLVDEKGNRKSDTPVLFKLDLDRLYNDSVKYNENLKTKQGSLLVDDYAYTQPSLDLQSYGITDGIFGYVSAESINMKLPIYLGANDVTMSYGAAHLTYTSLPLGGESTNTVLAGHTGYIGRTFFDNLCNLNIGDKVSIRTYWNSLTYKVAETKICTPSQSQDIFIDKGKDLLTMITCISNDSGEFDRYYVICERV